METTALIFLASIAPVTGAMKTMGDGGFRITFDMPETELAAYVRLHMLRGCVLTITIEIEDDGKTGNSSRYFAH